MAHTSVFEQIMEHIANGQVSEAEAMFHEFSVQTSKQIYESLVEGDDEETEDDDTEFGGDDDLDSELDSKEGEDFAADEDGDDDLDMDLDGDDSLGGDETDDLESDLTSDDEGDEDTEDLFQDLEDIVDQLQSKFDALNGGSSNTMDMDSDEDELKDDFSMSNIREYVERVSDGHGAEKKGKSESPDNKKSLIDNMKNDMGGTSSNILSSKSDDRGNEWGTAGGQLKGNGLTKGVQQMNTGNINVPGGKAGKTGFKNRVAAGHGAEKKGASEGKTEGTSLFRGRR